MKIIIAPDKFKNSLTAIEFCKIAQTTIQEQLPNAKIISLPLADGGDGSIDVIKHYIGGEMVGCKVKNPLFQEISAQYLWSEQNKTAFIEMAEASGLKRLKPKERNCMFTSTYGTGELIKDAIQKKGATKIILGIGGSATNDCGIGMATALGFQFLNQNKEQLNPIGKNLIEIKHINDSNILPELEKVKFEIACDVSNPLHGKNGAAYIYAAQKGANEKEIQDLDLGLKQFSQVIQEKYNIDAQKIKGAGAAGGMGIASFVFLNGKLKSGIEIVKNLADFDSKVENADWIITGEGSLDEQTLSGKVIQGVIKKAKENNINVATFSGQTQLSKQKLKDFGINYASSVIDKAIHLEDAMQNTKQYLKEIIEKFITDKLKS